MVTMDEERSAADRLDGIVSIITAIAKYVDPQTTYTIRSAATTAAADGDRVLGGLTAPLCRYCGSSSVVG